MNKRDRAKNRPASLASLQGLLHPGDTVYTVLRHVSQSGMMRHIDVVLIQGGVPLTISWHAATVLDYPTNDRMALKVGGAGMDMGFHVVYSLSRALFPDGFACIGEGCPANDHSNDYGELARQYDAEHDPEHTRLSFGEDMDVNEVRAIRTAYVSGRNEWISAQEPRLRSPERIHSDSGYALRHRWL